MASYKSEWLYNKYKGRLRPASHYTLGWLPRWMRLAALAPTLVNVLARIAPLRKLGLRMAGADPRREAPAFAKQTFRAWWSRRPRTEGERPRVVLWMDSFTNGFSPEIGTAAVAVLEDAGYEVVLPERTVCCGLTWISTGQLDEARRLLRASADALEPHLDAGLPIVGLEPSCTAVLRSDIRELLPDDPRSRRIASNTFTLAEFLTAPRAPHIGSWTPPRLDGVQVVAQPHCHQHSVMGWSVDESFLVTSGAEVTAIAGCCGLAGNFGMEKGHYDVSVAVAENGLLPALRAADPSSTVFLADGFSCRVQAQQLARRDGSHLAELLAARLAAGHQNP
jgi:Fe-S oxidoreductase